MHVPSVLSASTDLTRLIVERCPADFDAQSIETVSQRVFGVFEACVDVVNETVYGLEGLLDNSEDEEDEEEHAERASSRLRGLLSVSGRSGPSVYESLLETHIVVHYGEEVWSDPIFQELVRRHFGDREDESVLAVGDIVLDSRALLAAYRLVREWGPGNEPTLERGEDD